VATSIERVAPISATLSMQHTRNENPPSFRRILFVQKILLNCR